MYGVDVIVNDGIEHDNDHVDGEPLIWGLQIPNVRENYIIVLIQQPLIKKKR